MSEALEPVSPGEILLEEFMKPMGISQNKLSRDIDAPVGRINEIVHGVRAVTPDTALRLAAYFGTTPEFWMNLQSRFDLKIAKRRLGASIQKAVRPLQTKAS